MPTPNQLLQLNALNANFRTAYRGPTFYEDPVTGKIRQKDNGGVIVEIFDRTLHELYAKGTGIDESQALDDALTNARTAPKPKTPAQKADEAINGSLESRLAAANAELATLRAQVEAAAKVPPPAATPPELKVNADPKLPGEPTDAELDALLKKHSLQVQKGAGRSAKLRVLHTAGIQTDSSTTFQPQGAPPAATPPA